MYQSKYHPEIDGLRALAVASVIVYHAFPDALKGGFVGVDVFFVISGFLISTIILCDIRQNKFHFIEFYARRVRRIFPALAAVLCASLLFGWAVLLPEEYQQLLKHAAGGAGFVSNFVLWNETGYFDKASGTKPLLHLWSLGIEEQFYVFWPLILYICSKIKIPLPIIIACIGFTSFGFNIFESSHDRDADFYSPLARFWELMIGSAMAAIRIDCPIFIRKFSTPEKIRGLIRNAYSILGAGLIIAAVFCIDADQPFPGWLGLLPTIGACCLISAGEKAWFNRTVLSNRLVVSLGIISYPLYLWHWPLLAFMKILNLQETIFIRIIIILASIFLATTTYYMIERPIRFARLNIKIKTCAVAITLFLIGIVGLNNKNIPPRASETYPAFMSSERERDPELQSFDFEGRSYVFKESANKHKTFYLGDSNMAQYPPRLVKIIDENQAAANSAVISIGWGCAPIPEMEDDLNHATCRGFVDNALHYIKSHSDIDTVVIAAEWFSYFWDRVHTPYFYRNTDGSKAYLAPGSAGTKRAMNELDNFLRLLKGMNKKIYLILNIPVGGDFNPRNLIASRFSSDGFHFQAVKNNKSAFLDRYAPIRDELIRVAHENGAIVIDPMASLCSDDECLSIDENGPIYVDNEHLGASFVRERARYMDETIQAAKDDKN